MIFFTTITRATHKLSYGNLFHEKMTEWQNPKDLFGQHSKRNLLHYSLLFFCFSVISDFLAAISRKNCLVVYQRTEAPLLCRLWLVLIINPSGSLIIKEELGDEYIKILKVAGSSEI